jgi:hypothetical protein
MNFRINQSSSRPSASTPRIRAWPAQTACQPGHIRLSVVYPLTASIVLGDNQGRAVPMLMLLADDDFATLPAWTRAKSKTDFRTAYQPGVSTQGKQTAATISIIAAICFRLPHSRPACSNSLPAGTHPFIRCATGIRCPMVSLLNDSVPAALPARTRARSIRKSQRRRGDLGLCFQGDSLSTNVDIGVNYLLGANR